MVWYDNDYGYKKKITIDHTEVSGDETDFPVLISITDNDLRDEANGGHVKSANGYDIIFTNSAEDTQLKHEIERYVNTSGLLVFWVKVSSLSSTVDTDIYIYYGKAGVVVNPSSTDTWDANFKMVHHMNGSQDTDCDDSTSNSNDVDADGGNPTYQQAGKIGYGIDFDGVGDYLNVPDDNTLSFGDASSDTPFTFSAWIKMTDASNFFILAKGSSAAREYGFIVSAADKLYLACYDNTGAANINTVSVNGLTADQGSWIFVVGTYDGSSLPAGLNLYRNGALMASNDASTAYTAMHNQAQPLRIAEMYGWGEADGEIDEVRISGYERSLNWIVTTYNSQNAPAGFMSWGAEESKPSGDVSAGIKIWDGTADIELIKDDASPVKIETPSGTIGVKLVATADGDASAIRIRVDGATTKAFKKKT